MHYIFHIWYFLVSFFLRLTCLNCYFHYRQTFRFVKRSKVHPLPNLPILTSGNAEGNSWYRMIINLLFIELTLNRNINTVLLPLSIVKTVYWVNRTINVFWSNVKLLHFILYRKYILKFDIQLYRLETTNLMFNYFNVQGHNSYEASLTRLPSVQRVLDIAADVSLDRNNVTVLNAYFTGNNLG